MKSKRIPKELYYLNIAREIAKRSTCLRRRFGAILVKNDSIIAAGYAGAPRGTPHCIDLGRCRRAELNVPSGQRYELCRGVHAELNAIISAARTGAPTVGSKMYLIGENYDGTLAQPKPCSVCRRAIINAGIEEVIVPLIGVPNGIKRYKVKNWIKENKKDCKKGGR